MMEDDVLLRQIARFAHFVARWLHGEDPSVERADALDREAISLFGLDLPTLRRIPPTQVPLLFPADAPGGVGRWLLVARTIVLGASLEPRPMWSQRAAQALGIVEIALATDPALDANLLAETLAELTALTRTAG